MYQPARPARWSSDNFFPDVSLLSRGALHTDRTIVFSLNRRYSHLNLHPFCYSWQYSSSTAALYQFSSPGTLVRPTKASKSLDLQKIWTAFWLTWQSTYSITVLHPSEMTLLNHVKMQFCWTQVCMYVPWCRLTFEFIWKQKHCPLHLCSYPNQLNN